MKPVNWTGFLSDVKIKLTKRKDISLISCLVNNYQQRILILTSYIIHKIKPDTISRAHNDPAFITTFYAKRFNR